MPIQYMKLDSEAAEIRLLHLAPGEFTDPVRFCLSYASLRPPDPPQRKRLSLEEGQKTLPPVWTVAETEQDRYRFLFEEDETENTTWTHPGPNCDPESWQSLEELPPKGYEPAFDALSYIWGASGSCEKALVEYRGLEDQASMDFPMQENLASALRHLRYPDRTRTLWVDAICINVDDAAERAHQVKQMWRLYRLCQRVMVWLGPESPNSKLAISTLRHLGAQLEVSRDNWQYRSPQATEMEWFRAVCPLPYDAETWEAIADFLHRAWFERLWIWQEIQLANSQAMVICGREEVPWRSLRRAVICLETKQELPSLGLRRRLGLVKMLTLKRGSSSIYVLLNISRQRKCFNPKDKIYGMLSICGPTLADKIEPHYSGDWSVADVYTDVPLKHLEQVDRLDLLSACDSALKLDNGPSWIPDWSVPRTTEPLSPFVFASGISAAQARYLGRGILQVHRNQGCSRAKM